MKRIIIILLFVFIYCNENVFSQTNPDLKRTWHWYFGDKAGLDFSSGSPVAVTNGQMSAVDGTVSLSDTSGNFLFYSDGFSVWNRNHQIMPNGTGLVGPYGSSGYKQIIAVPQPDHNNFYYIFSWEYDSTYIHTREIYAIIDMNQDGGLGDVISKRNYLMYDVAEKRTAVMHKNRKDIWIVVPKFATNAFYSFLLTNSGINTVPVISTAGVIDNYGTCRMKFSPDGSLLANGLRFTGQELLKFDNSSGVVSDYINFPSFNNCEEYGFEFSPDGKKLYYTVYSAITNPTPVNTHNAIYQVSLVGDSAAIVNSRILLDTAEIIDNGHTTSFTHSFSYILQKGSDEKIYSTNEGTSYLGCINFPNNAGISCNYIDNAISLNNRICGTGLPYFLSNYFLTDTISGINNYFLEKAAILDQNSPNPYKEETIIKYKLPESVKEAKIEFNNIDGELVKTDYLQGRGNGVMHVYASNLSSGIYTYTLIADGKVIDTKKLICLEK